MNKNKWLIIILAAIAVIAVTVAIVVIAVSGKSDVPETPEYTEGPEVGVYYYDVADGVMTLTLSGGNRFTLTSPNTNKTGSYSVEGSALTLDFIKDSDGTATGTIDGEKISLVLNNATIPFLKQVNRTVTFNGTDLAAATVVNGKTVAKPQDPVKENHVFLGWYADAEYTTAFDFENTTIKKDITVYAKWAAGTPDFEINFDLGYDAVIDSTVAISGKVYGMPVPEREGYTFGGWYASMYDDGAKLTYKCDENSVFTADTILYAVWYETGKTALNAPAVTVGANAISWSAVAGATSYKLTVVGPDGTAIIDNKTVGATTEAFDFATKEAGEYKISVVAVASDAANNSAPAERYYANKTLSKVTSFHVENGILIFGAVENAEKYVLNVVCGNPAHNHTAVDNGNSTTYYLGNCTMQKGGILITVTAKANGYADSVSKVYSYEKTLAAAQNVVYNAEADTITWNPVVGAVNYVVTVTVGETPYTFNNGSITSFSVAGFTGAFTVSVVPATEGCNSPDATVVNVTKTAPAAPSGLTVVGSVVSWNTVEGATSYEVNVDGKTVTVETNSVDLATAAITLTPGQTYTVKVKAFNENNEDSSYCAAVKFGYNAFDGAISYNKNHVSWIPVLSADGSYEVKVNGEVQKTVENASSAKIVLTQEGDNVIEVRFVSDDYTSEWATLTVKAYAVEYDTRSTAGIVAIEYVAVGDELTLPSTGFEYKGHSFAGWYNAPKGTEGNGKLYAEGSVFNGTAYTVVYAGWTPNVYDLTVSLGGEQVSNFEGSEVFKVTYSKDFFITPAIPAMPSYTFKGWYTAPSGSGIQLTDDKGNSIAPYYEASSITIYPYLINEAVEYALKTDAKGKQYYTASKGIKIGEITELTIAADIDGIPVTEIVASGFTSCYTLETVNIPDSIKVVGDKAFRYCRELKAVNVYVAYPEEAGLYETVYSSYEGTLIRNDFGTMYLEYVPQAKSGDFTIPEKVTHVLENAFYRTSLDSVTIPANVTSVPKYAFNESSTLKTITFAERTDALELGSSAFYKCTAVETVNISASYAPEMDDLFAFLNQFSTLKAINVTEGNTAYASKDGVLTNGTNTILYAPKAYAAEYVIPDGITIIRAGAFNGRTNVTSVTVPSWVTDIGRDAFNNCSGIKSIIFKGSRSDVLEIGANAFANHRALTTVTFEASENTALDAAIIIGTNAFAGGSASKSFKTIDVQAGTNIANIGEGAFKNNTVLANINVDPKASVGVIGKSAFAYCSGLSSIDIPATVTRIDSYAFSRCTSLTEINFVTEGATSIDIADYAFNECSKLGTILLPNHLNEFKSSAFNGCELLKEIKVNPDNEKYTNTADGILFKRTVDESNNLIYTDILFDPKGLAKDKGGVIDNLPETLVNIGGAAFSSNPYITEIHIPAAVTIIDSSAFANCSHLKTLVFKAGGTALEIGDYAFENCTELDNTFALPDYTTKIGNYAFVGCEFSSFTVPANVSSIGNGAFYKCKFLKNVSFNTTVALTLGAGASSEEEGVFSGCVDLEAVALPKTLTSIGRYAFYGCASLENVTFGTTTYNDGVWSVDSNLTAIKDYAFYGCTSLESIVIPNTVTTVGAYAFAVAPGKTCSLETVYFELGGTETLNVAAGAFENNKALTKVYFPARVELISADTVVDASWQIIADDQEMPAMISDIFTGCESLAEINVASEVGVTPKYASLDGVLYNADMTVLIYSPVANVGIYVDGVPTYEIKVPNTVQVVASGAFVNANALRTVTFVEFDKTSENYGKNILSIGNITDFTNTRDIYYFDEDNPFYTLNVFGGARSSLTTINLPSHLKKFSSMAFATKGTNSLDLNINPDANNVEIAFAAFAHSNVTKVKLSSVKSLGDYTFFESTSIAEVDFGTWDSSIEKIPEGMFQMYWGSAYNLTSFVIPEQITEIGDYAFYNCAGLTSINIHGNITAIGNNAFFYCYGLTSIVIPKSVTTLGDGIFTSCINLETVTFELDEDGNSPITKIPKGTFQSCRKLTNVNVNDLDLTEIGQYAFSGCEVINEIDFTNFTKLTVIDSYAFTSVPYEHVDLSKTQLKKLTNAFATAKQLKTLKLPDSVTSVVASALSSADAMEKLYVGKNFTPAMIATMADKGKIDEIIVPEDSTTLYKENGVIYESASKTTIAWADRNADLSDYEIPSTVKTINKYAFSYVQLGDLVIPENVTKIDAYAFYAAKLDKVSISTNAYTKLENYVFNSSTVTEVEWLNESESKLTTFGNNVFGATPLTKFEFPDSVTTLPTSSSSSPLKDCKELETVIYSAKISSIPQGTLSGCVSISKIVIQEGTTVIKHLYSNVKTGTSTYPPMESIDIPASVTELDTNAFNSFGNLTTINFASGSKLKTVDNYAFNRCVALETVNLPSTVTTLGTFAFNLCSGLTSIDLSATGITAIGESAFQDTTNLATVKLPDKVTSIGKNAFLNSGITVFNAPKKLTTIGESAFQNATKLESVIFPADAAMKNLGDSTNVNIFKGATSLTTLVIPNTLNSIGDFAFVDTALTTVTLTEPEFPAQIQTIGQKAFYECSNLTSFDFLENATSIGDYAFFGCTELTKATLGENVTNIGTLAFGLCSKLEAAYIPASVTTMGGNPFGGLSVEKVTLNPDNNAFRLEEKDGIKVIYDADGFTIYGVWGATGNYVIPENVYGLATGALMNNAITSISVPKKLGTVGDYMFYNCTDLATVDIAHGINAIGNYAFYNTALTTVDIPKTVTYLGSYCFAYCEELDNVVVPASVTVMREGVFAYDTKLANVSFASSDELVDMGMYTFYNCVSLTKVVLPNHFFFNWDDFISVARLLGNTTIKPTENGIGTYARYCIPAYTFSGTGIVNAELPFVRYLCTLPIFNNCANLETIRFQSGAESGSSDLNNPVKNDETTAAWLEGCDNLKAVYIGFIGGPSSGVDKVNYDEFGKTIERMYMLGVKEFHIENIDFRYYNSGLFYLGKIGEDASIYFDNNTYEEVAEFFKYCSYTSVVKMYDKDGNRLICSTTCGIIASVQDKDGNTIWTNPVTDYIRHPDDQEQI